MLFKKKQQTIRRQFNIKEVFSKMEAKGVKTNKELLWSYYFVNKNIEPLEKLKDKLLDEGLTFIEISKHDDNKFWLHVEEVCIHTYWTLIKRCDYFNDLAEEFNIEYLDGWDVGNPDKTRSIADVI